MHVVTRRSTDMIAIDDPKVAAALAFIHDHAADPIGVDDVVRHLQMSHRNIEIRFQNLVGRTRNEIVSSVAGGVSWKPPLG